MFVWIRRLLPKTLLTRSLLIIVTPLILIQVVMAYVFYDNHWSRSNTRIAAAIAGDVALIASHYVSFEDTENRAWMNALAKAWLGLDVALTEGRRLSQEPAFVSKWTAPFFLTAELDRRLDPRYRIDGRRYPQEVTIDVEVPDGLLQIIVPAERFAESNTHIFVMWMAATSLVLFLLALLFMNSQVKPLRRLARAADDFGKGRDVDDFQIRGASEVRLAAAAFMNMKRRIQRQLAQRVEMLAGVSHDLRTPLTRMRLQLALSRESPETDDLKSDIAEMETMLEGYLAFARGEGGEDSQEIDIGDLLREIAAAARRDGSTVRLATEGDMLLPVRPIALKRSVTNLVGNAQRHADTVEINAQRRNGAIGIVIDDDGPGVPDEELDGVFKPFYRLDPSRNPETGGVGLGLTIARDVIRGHGGDIRLSRSPLGGLRAEITLPI